MVTVNQAYGTDRLNANDILETTLNLRPVEVKDPVDYIDPNTGEEKTIYAPVSTTVMTCSCGEKGF